MDHILGAREYGFKIECEGNSLIAILSRPVDPAPRGVLIVVGGPQYRAGSHRQFVLLARHLAANGIPAMRFDYRGMGDSEGATKTFENVGADIRAATDGFFAHCPGLQEVVIWGLCDAASAASFYAHQDSRVCALVLVNPWVRSEQGIARAYLKHYYTERLFDPELWRKIRSGAFDVRAAGRSLAVMISGAVRGRRTAPATGVPTTGTSAAGPSVGNDATAVPLADRMVDSLELFTGRLLLILSGRDLTAQEFKDALEDSARWRKMLASSAVVRRDLAQADHTFSRREWRDEVAKWTAEWLNSW